MNKRLFLLGSLCLGVFLSSSCKKDDANISKEVSPGNTREAVWKEVAKISAVSKFSKIDTLKVNQNIDDGVLSIAKLRETFTPLTGGVPIMVDEYNETTYVSITSGVTCVHNFTFQFWDLKSRGYPSIYTAGWSDTNPGTQSLTYDGYDPYATYTFTSISFSGNCSNVAGYANLEEEIFGLHRNWTVETQVSHVSAAVWSAKIKLKKVN